MLMFGVSLTIENELFGVFFDVWYCFLYFHIDELIFELSGWTFRDRVCFVCFLGGDLLRHIELGGYLCSIFKWSYFFDFNCC
jgi:hypothetical protein